MPQETEICIVMMTAPDAELAASIGRALIQEKTAACMNVIPSVRSIYEWDGNVCDDSEVLCIIKTRPQLVPQLCARITELHPYQNPEIIALPVNAGNAPYLAWVAAQTTVPKGT